jgi:hypothetical protein
VKQPGHLTSMKKERGAGTRVFSLCFLASLFSMISLRDGDGVGIKSVRGRSWVEEINCENLKGDQSKIKL